MKKLKGFFEIEERDNGDIIWTGFPAAKTGGNKPKTFEKIYKISEDLQNDFTNTSNIPLKRLNDKDRETYKEFLKSLDFENYKAIRGETKSANYKHYKSNFNDRVNKSNLEGLGIEEIIIPSNIIDIYTRLKILL